MSQLPLAEIIHQYEETNQKLSNTSDTEILIKLGKAQKKAQPKYELASEILSLESSLAKNEKLLTELDSDEQELILLTKEEIDEQKVRLESLNEQLLSYLAPQDPMDDSDVLLEIRAAAGGDESSLFAAEILKMYTHMCQKQCFSIKTISFSENELGGYKEVICEIRGDGAFSWFKYEGGVHRVQRVPATEKQGRVHTSTVSVVIMPLIENNNSFKLDMNEVEIVASTSQGAGGQSVNTTYSAIKTKHIPTGIEAQCQDERNQQQNKLKALQILTSRVFDYYEQERLAKESAARRVQVGRGDRSEKIRTYNFPQDRLTDHRFSHSWNQLPLVMTGRIESVIEDIKKIVAKQTLEQLTH
ncbi:MAG: PCRF domain-containing protein [Patescibacteria group bacterium]